MSTAFRRIRRPGRTIAVAVLALTAASMSACTDAHGKPNLFGIPLPSISKSSDDDLTERENRQLEVFDSMVRNPSTDIDPEIRVTAAEELIAMDIQPATDRLCDALRSGEPVVVSAVIDAIELSPEPVDGLLPAVTETLSDASDEQMEKLFLVLPRYGDEALALVAAAARDRSEPPARRVVTTDVSNSAASPKAARTPRAMTMVGLMLFHCSYHPKAAAAANNIQVPGRRMRVKAIAAVHTSDPSDSTTQSGTFCSPEPIRIVAD